MTGYVEAIEVLGNNVAVHVGGGGQAETRVVEVEVYTSGNNGMTLSCFNNLKKEFFNCFLFHQL